MTNSTLRIITRESPLAIWQAEHVRDRLNKFYPDLEINIHSTTTKADNNPNVLLENLGGKGAFVKELEQALLEDRADFAVHSMKDVVVSMPDGLSIAAVLKREQPGDAFVSVRYNSLDDMPPGSIVGTSSLRRQCQLKAIRTDLSVKSIRGNVGTRLRKLDEDLYDALILASSGLNRLGLGDRIKYEMNTEQMLPAIGQGALGIEVRCDDDNTIKIVEALNDEDTRLCVTAERMVNKRLNGGCLAPIAAYAIKDGDSIKISALVGNLDGSRLIKSHINGPAIDAEALGDQLGLMLLERGAGGILAEIQRHEDE